MTDRKTRVGLFGFGRIGRNVFRQVVDHPTIEVAAICHGSRLLRNVM